MNHRSSIQLINILRIGTMLMTYSLMAHNAMAQTATVSNIQAEQRQGTKLVDIWYDLSYPGGGAVDVMLTVNNNTQSLAAISVAGDRFAVSPGTDRLMTWDAGADWSGQISTNMRFILTSAPNYLIIDLSSGPSASTYPVTFMNAVPAGGWADEYKTTKLVMRRIPQGTFTMGSPDGEVFLTDGADEEQHDVTFTTDFYVGVFEVTQKQWERVMGDWPSWYSNAAYRNTRPVESLGYCEIRENPDGSDDPAVQWPSNSAANASSFIGKLRAKTGLSTIDLPTESQWEYACRAGTTTALNSGYDLISYGSDTNMDVVGRYIFNQPGGSSLDQNATADSGSAAVGSYQPNAWGLYDMHGNVNEWCLDWYSATYPGTVTDPVGPSSYVFDPVRVHRGGSFFFDAKGCRSAERFFGDHTNAGQRFQGFRIARTMP